MEHDFWLERWADGQTGFHQPTGNSMLHKHWRQLELPAASRVLVPLCGKTQDMLWLADQGHHVTGIELSEIAAREFFSTAGLGYRKEHASTFERFISPGIEIRVGDFFDLSMHELARFDAFYDRAALIALPGEMQQAYVNHLMSGLRRGATGLLITLCYDPTLMEGPPFSVDDENVGRLYGQYAHVDLLAEQRGLGKDDKLRKRGLKNALQGIYRIVRN